jgi:hypothetical protein
MTNNNCTQGKQRLIIEKQIDKSNAYIFPNNLVIVIRSNKLKCTSLSS